LPNEGAKHQSADLDVRQPLQDRVACEDTLVLADEAGKAAPCLEDEATWQIK
jgi:hypothetical protein